MMKKLVSSLLLISLLWINNKIAFAQEKLEGTITLSGAWAIYPTAVAWAESFQKINPGVKIDISAGGAGKGAADAIAGLVDIGMVSRDPDPAEIKKGIIPIYVLHDAVYPVVNSKNPVLSGILKKGINKKTFENIYISGIITKWDDASGQKLGKPIHVYTRSDACGAASSWAGYLGKKQEDLKGVGVFGDPGLLEAVKRDPIGIGYSNFSFVFKRDGNIVDGVNLIPIDSNGNGAADQNEIYKTRDDAIKAIRDGKYPARRKNYFFVKGKPKGIVKKFIEFALSDEGSKVVDETGASLSLTKADREKVLGDIK